MTDLAAFVTARLNEDEAAALAVSDGPRQPEEWVARQQGARPPRDWLVDCPFGTVVVDGSFRGPAEHIARHDPARVLRDVAAKRARLALMNDATAEMNRLVHDDTASAIDRAMAIGMARAATIAVKHDAAAWSGHPDYQQEWLSPPATGEPPAT